jgi:hypothetical protein
VIRITRTSNCLRFDHHVAASISFFRGTVRHYDERDYLNPFEAAVLVLVDNQILHHASHARHHRNRLPREDRLHVCVGVESTRHHGRGMAEAMSRKESVQINGSQ